MTCTTVFRISLTMVLCLSRFELAVTLDTEESMCPSVVYLKVGKEGQIPCTCGSFTIVAWYWKGEYDNRGTPIINYDKEQKTGHGYSSRLYDIAEDGSLIISSVTRHHEGDYVVTVADDSQHREDTIIIKVIVVVPSAPSYPVVNDKINQQHVYMDVNRNGTLRCAMFGVYPDVNLTFTSESNKIVFQHHSVLKTPVQNNTFDVTFNMHYSVTDLTVKRLTIFCKVAGDDIAKVFPDETRVDLLFLPVYPVVNGYIDQSYVYLDANREGQLNCWKENVDAETTLTWEVVGSSLEGRVSIESFRNVSKNPDGTLNINQIVNYTADYSVDRILLLCKAIQPNTGHVFATKVDLLFENVYPVVNGHASQKHLFLDVDREGHLTCIKENVDAGTILEWKIVDTNMQKKIAFQSKAVVLENNDGKVTINQTFDYEIHDHLVDRITLECEVITPGTNDSPLTTKVDLLFQSVYPVVNGHLNQNHVYLDMDRMGHLTCVKENVNAGTTLDWVLDSNLHRKVSFRSRTITLVNSDGTVNINQTFDYEVLDNSLDRITLKCSVIERDSVEHPFTTMVELLFSVLPPFPDPVISGCYHQQHDCVLKVERSGELSCTTKNSHHPVDLKWTTLDGDKAYLVFEKTRVKSHNSTNLHDVSITTPYTVVDQSVTLVTIQCDAYRTDSGQVLAVAKTTLEITDGDTNKSTCSYIWAVVLPTVSSVIVHALLVLILWYKNRKMHKKVAEKFLQPLLDRYTHDEHPLPQEGTNGTNPYRTANGQLVRYSSEVCDSSRQEVEDLNESLHPPDSGNSGSNSRELSGSEACEQSGLMDDIEMANCNFSNQDPLVVNEGRSDGAELV